MSGVYQASDTGQPYIPDIGTFKGVIPASMMGYNGRETWKTNRRPPQSDVDGYPSLIRTLTNMSVTDVQLNNGLFYRVGSGKRINYAGAGYLNVVQPRIPGQTRDNVSGYHRRGPSPYNVADLYMNGPGSQPNHPGGPGEIAGPTFINPMSG